MKLAIGICLFFMAIGLFPGEVLTSEQNDEELVQLVIKESTEKYYKAEHEAELAATINGAQSRRPGREIVKSTEYSKLSGRIHSIYTNALKELTSKHKMDHTVALQQLEKFLPPECQPKQNMICNETARYRTVDGTCNNLKNPSWGSVNQPNRRLIDPVYAANDEPRGGRVSTLPGSRDLSVHLHQGNGTNLEINATHMVAQFGQFLDHDFSLTPVDDEKCCGNPSAADKCWTIRVNATDPHYSEHNVTCLEFVRSTPSCLSSSLARREQMNAITAYIDGSVVYGSSEILQNVLRSHKGGRLVQSSVHKNFLPWKSDVYPGADSNQIIAGDVRANEMPGLTTLHTLFLREHNRIADEFAKLTEWDDERIFQETRRIIGAELQQVTYNEFLPAILGPDAMKQHGLNLPPEGYTTYNASVDASIYSHFSTAAYRFGHTLVNGLIQLMLNDKVVGNYSVRENYLISDQVITLDNNVTGYDLILNGLIRQNAQAFDGEIHTDMTNNLFMDRVSKIGTDLAARNIQRGRDHGTPSYNAFRKFCKITPLTNWTDKPDDFTQANWEKLQGQYKTVDDIDLYTGGLFQSTVSGGLSGRTLVCLQAIQFQNLMHGDRFFFTHENQIGSFTPEQLSALRKRTLGHIICQNSDLTTTQINVFSKIHASENPSLPCSALNRTLDISLFAVTPSPSASSLVIVTLPTLLVCLVAQYLLKRF